MHLFLHILCNYKKRLIRAPKVPIPAQFAWHGMKNGPKLKPTTPDVGNMGTDAKWKESRESMVKKGCF